MTPPLTSEELSLVTNPEVLLTKNKIIRDVYELFGELADAYKKEVNKLNFQIKSNGKISKGENYNGLPYVILDYPNIFSRTDIFAIRSFFWWGHFFSITLHLSGKYQQQYAESLRKAVENKMFDDWYICRADDQWQHHFEESNFKPTKDAVSLGFDSLPFIKLATKIPLQEWDQSFNFFVENFKLLLRVLAHQAPMR